MLVPGSSNLRPSSGVTRREFLRAGSLGVAGLSLADFASAQTASAAQSKAETNCIVLYLLGGPSHIDTWDPKPEAPVDVRGPFRPIRTNVPGIHIGEHFPRMARMAHRYALVRSVYHREAPIHETGHQLVQTGRLSRHGVEHPSLGSVLARIKGPRSALPPYVVLPHALGNTGVNVSRGQGAGYLGESYEPVCTDLDFDGTRDASRALDRERPALRNRYGRNAFGQSCLMARRLIEGGVRLATVNMFETVFNTLSWDCHADGGSLSVTLDDYKRTLCPMFDRAYTALLSDLDERGMLASTLVVAMGEFGRTPKLNAHGGRDHWPGVWTVLLAGGGVQGGRVVGSSDKHGAEPRTRPVHASEVAATIYHALGIDPGSRLSAPDGRSPRLVEAEPVRELFA